MKLNVTLETVREAACSLWVGTALNLKAKLRNCGRS